MESEPIPKKPRTRCIIGNVFAVDLEENQAKYFQYVADDLSQLSSRVIRVFKKAFDKEEKIDFRELVRSEVQFYAHVFLRVGLKFGYWKKVGHAAEVGTVDVYFRDSRDYGNPEVKRSERWDIWKINGPSIYVGKLEGQYREAEIGVVVAPPAIADRMKTGRYHFVYPEF